jgi:hypothetical protein
MAVTLAQAATLSENDLQAGVLETFVRESVILDRLPFMEIEGNAYAYNAEGTLPGVEFRAVNAAYTESTGTVNQSTESLVILGGDADVDTFIQKTRGNVNDQRATQNRLKVKAASYKFQDAFFNGDDTVDVNSFDGLKVRLTGAQVIDAATDGLNVLGNGTTDPHLFLDKLDELIAAVPGCQVLYMNSLIRAKILAALRRINVYTETVGRLPESMQAATNTATVEATIPLYNGIPMIDPGDNLAGTKILPQTEVQGTSGAACSSIYAVRFGEDEGDQAVTGLTNGGVDVRDLGETDAKPALRTRIEFFCGVGVFGGKAGARLRGVKNG